MLGLGIMKISVCCSKEISSIEESECSNGIGSAK